MGLILKEKQEEKKLLLKDLKYGDIGIFNNGRAFIITDDGFYVFLNTGRCYQIGNSDKIVTLLPPGTTFIIEE